VNGEDRSSSSPQSPRTTREGRLVHETRSACSSGTGRRSSRSQGLPLPISGFLLPSRPPHQAEARGLEGATAGRTSQGAPLGSTRRMRRFRSRERRRPWPRPRSAGWEMRGAATFLDGLPEAEGRRLGRILPAAGIYCGAYKGTGNQPAGMQEGPHWEQPSYGGAWNWAVGMAREPAHSSTNRAFTADPAGKPVVGGGRNTSGGNGEENGPAWTCRTRRGRKPPGLPCPPDKREKPSRAIAGNHTRSSCSRTAPLVGLFVPQGLEGRAVARTFTSRNESRFFSTKPVVLPARAEIRAGRSPNRRRRFRNNPADGEAGSGSSTRT